jgi:hypothetical protein
MKDEQKITRLDIILTSEMREEIEVEKKELKDEIKFLKKTLNILFITTILFSFVFLIFEKNNLNIIIWPLYLVVHFIITFRTKLFKNNLFGLENIDREIDSFIKFYNESEELIDELSNKDVPDTIEVKKYFYFHKIFK